LQKGDFVERLSDEAEYVLIVLHQMRSEVIAKPRFFDPLVLKQIDEAIAQLHLTGKVSVA
jgi:hypothetical protein